MAQNITLTIPANTWTMITDASVTAVRVQNKSLFTVELSATASIVAPSNSNGSLDLAGGETLAADLTLAQIFPGVAGASRLWVYSKDFSAVLSVSHA